MTTNKKFGFDGRVGVQHYMGDKPSNRFDWKKSRKLFQQTMKEVYGEQ